jgi:ribosomal protein S12 methylthiotransferase accessory factor
LASSYGDFERTTSATKAISQVADALERAGLRSALSSVGRIIKTTTCTLQTPDGRTCVGKGKGVDEQSAASAIYEALEHLWYEAETPPDHSAIRRLDLSGADSAFANGSPDFGLVCSGAPIPLTRTSYRGLQDPSDELLFPAFLMNPRFRSECAEEERAIAGRRLRRYSTNSGTAAGVSWCEALLHGLLEVIERDAIGIELLRSVIRDAAHPVREIQRETLPTGLTHLCSRAEEESRLNLSILDITTELGVPAVLAMLGSNDRSARTYFGSGASLSAAYAIERAVLECVQSFHTHTALGVPLPCSHLGSLDQASRYQRCFMDAGHFAYRGGMVRIAFQDLKQPAPAPERLSPEAQVTFLTQLLNSHGMKSYWRKIATCAAHVVQVVVPRLERFHLTTYGVPVAPSARGRAVLT